MIAFNTYRLTEVLQTVTALLAIVALGVALMTLAAMVVPAAAAWRSIIIEWRSTITLGIAAVSTAGSLYFSEVANYVPCTLCWYQRIAMYPLAVIGAVWLIRGGCEGRAYVLPIAAVGALISTYHYLIEWNPSLDSGVCAASGPACSDVWFRSFGFVTLALMALVAFVAIITVNVVSPRSTD